jgi:DNA polymerase-3 subunit epsilon
MRQILLDTETTGLEPKLGHRIIEVACVEMVSRRLTRNDFHRYLNPERNIDAGATQVHGLTLDFLLDKPKFGDIADELLEYVRGAEIIIHNAPFDVGFLNAELAKLGKAPLTEICRVIDTLAMARELHPGRKNTLDALCERYSVDNSARVRHGALLDAELLGDVYLAMTRGQDSLAIGIEAMDAAAQHSVHGNRPAALKVMRASEEELRLHVELVERLDKTSGGKCLWKQGNALNDAPPGVLPT